MPLFLSNACMVVATVVQVVQVGFTVAEWHRKNGHKALNTFNKTRRMLLFMFSLTLISCAAVGLDYYIRNKPSPLDMIASWGWGNQAFYIGIKTDSLSSYADDYHLLLITRIPYSNINRLTDTGILKSTLYNIDSSYMILAATMAPGLRVAHPGLEVVEFNLALLPKQFSADQIKTLNDIKALGGKILANPQASMMFISASKASSKNR